MTVESFESPTSNHDRAHKRKNWILFIILAIINFCVLFNYTVLRNLKDALLITAAESGSEVVGFVKTWLILPSSILLTMIMSRLSARLNHIHLFPVTLLPFLIFFLVFGLFLYPNLNFFHISPHIIAHWKQQYINFQWIFPIFGNWMIVCFYILAELFGSASICYGFWLLANNTMDVQNAKKFYPLFGIIGNTALFIAGWSTEKSSTLIRHDPIQIVRQQTLLITACGFIAIILAYAAKILSPQGQPSNISKSSNKTTPSIIKVFRENPIIVYLFILVFAYGCCINLVELTWKSKIKALFPFFSDYNRYMGSYTKKLGLVSMCIPILSSFIMRRFSWKVVALTTPFILSTWFIFFILNIFPALQETIASLFHIQALNLLVSVGTFSAILSKSAKYSFFDPSKELVYIPLTKEVKNQGKAIVDLMGTRSGKGFSALYQQFLLIMTASQLDNLGIPILILFTAVIFFWFWSIHRIQKTVPTLSASQSELPPTQ